MPRIEIETEHSEQAEYLAESSSERFDRMAFAERAVALVRPPHTKVAICQGSRRVHVTSGREWGRHADARWAILSVPHDASRRAIARAVLELGDYRVPDEPIAAGTGEANPYRRSTPAWRLDVLVTLLGGDAPPAAHAKPEGGAA